LTLQLCFLEAPWLTLIMSFLQEIGAVTLLMDFGDEPLPFELFLLVILVTWVGFLSFIVGVLDPLLVWMWHRVYYFLHFEQFFIIDLAI
jgi:hypothetical protein